VSTWGDVPGPRIREDDSIGRPEDIGTHPDATPGVCPDCGHDHETLECAACPEGYCERVVDLESYCATCGAKVGHFIDHGDAWRHFRGSGTVADPNVLYEVDHEADVGWREPS
jgi:hypothetical protein